MEQKEPKTKAELLQFVQDGRHQFKAILNEIPQERMEEKGVETNWSVKDILAHITAWETKMTQVLGAMQTSDERPDWPVGDEGVDALNATFYEANKNKPLAQVLTEFEASYPRALAATEAMSETDLFNPDRFAWRKGRPLWWMVAGNTFGHYWDHIPNIEAWLGS
jgi:hypothetical protein